MDDLGPPIQQKASERSRTATQPHLAPINRPAPRTLLPAVQPDGGATGLTQVDEVSILSKRIKPTSTACDRCRKYKIKCDGLRPCCRKCSTKGANCVYQPPTRELLKRTLAELESSGPALDVFQALQTRGGDEAAAIFERIRAGADPQTIMRQIREGDLLLQLQLTPESRRRYDFPYNSQMPDHLQAFHNPYLHSLIYEWTCKDNAPRQPSGEFSRRSVFKPPHAATLKDANVQSPLSNDVAMVQYLKPYHAATLVDARFDKIIPSRWTTVSKDDDLMRAIIIAYFQFDYPYVTYFHIDCFLDDMVDGIDTGAGRGQSCSSLLVNTILASGCNCLDSLERRTEHWNPQTYGYKFMSEAKRLWELETSRKGRLAKLQATMLFNIYYNISGIDKIGSSYLPHIAAMVQDLGLFEPSTIRDARLRLSREYTAWCFYWWQSFVCHLYRKPVLVTQLPEMPLPDPDKFPEWYGEMWIKYPQNYYLVLMLNGHVQKAKIEFAQLLNLATQKLFMGSEPIHDDDDTVLDLIIRIAEWYYALPESLACTRIVLPSHFSIRIHCFAILAELFGSLSPEARSVALRQAAQAEGSLWDMISKSEAYVETLIRLYYIRHSFERADTMMTHFLTTFALLMAHKLELVASSPFDNLLEDTTGSLQPDVSANVLRSSIVLAEKGLSDQGRCHYFRQTAFHIVLNQLHHDDATRALVLRYADMLEESEADRHQRIRHMQSQYPVPIVKVTDGIRCG